MSDKAPSHISSLIEPTIILSLITAVLYFWGYMYYGVFCETIGIFPGAHEQSFQAYIIVGWDKILYIAMALCILLSYWEISIWLLVKIIEWSLKKTFKKHHDFWKKLFDSPKLQWIHSEDAPKTEFFRVGIILLITMSCTIGGMNSLVDQAKYTAHKIVEVKRLIIIRDSQNQPIDGTFFYIADFDGELVVGELSSNKDSFTGIRIFKPGSYGSYTLDRKPAEEPSIEPTPEIEPATTEPTSKNEAA